MRSCLKPSSFHEPRHRGIRDHPAFYAREYVGIPLLPTGELYDMKGLRCKGYPEVRGFAFAALHFLSGDGPDVPIGLIEMGMPHRLASKTGQHEQSQRQLRQRFVAQ